MGGAEFAGPENDGPQKNNDWKMQALENDGPNRTPGICKTWKMTDLT